MIGAAASFRTVAGWDSRKSTPPGGYEAAARPSNRFAGMYARPQDASDETDHSIRLHHRSGRTVDGAVHSGAGVCAARLHLAAGLDDVLHQPYQHGPAHLGDRTGDPRRRRRVAPAVGGIILISVCRV